MLPRSIKALTITEQHYAGKCERHWDSIERTRITQTYIPYNYVWYILILTAIPYNIIWYNGGREVSVIDQRIHSRILEKKNRVDKYRPLHPDLVKRLQEQILVEYALCAKNEAASGMIADLTTS